MFHTLEACASFMCLLNEIDLSLLFVQGREGFVFSLPGLNFFFLRFLFGWDNNIKKKKVGLLLKIL